MRQAAAFIASIATTFLLAATFYTQQVLAKQAAFGAAYSPDQQIEAYVLNYQGLAPAYGAILSIALLIGFLVAGRAKRFVAPLAPVAYPLAGAAAVLAALWLIDTFVVGGRVGLIGGARDAFGLTLQALAGAAGGLVFALARGR